MLTDPTNGQVMFMTTTYTSTADYFCNIGYKLVGVNERNCTAAGTWSGGEPTCQGKSYKTTKCFDVFTRVIISWFN